MKLLVIGDEKRFLKYMPELDIVKACDVTVVDRGTPDEEIIRLAGAVDFIAADAVSPVSATLMDAFPDLKLIHSEGVAYNAIDVRAATERGITVCNNAGVNAGAVAEQTVLLMLACLRHVVEGDRAVRSGQQIQMKERLMVEGLRELGDCKVGLVGLGNIAVETALRLHAFGCDVSYWNRNRRPAGKEEQLHVTYLPLDELARTCDIVSIHVPVTPDTEKLVDAAFLESMKPDAILVNTARGEIVDQAALADALERGVIGGAGLDTLSPEPVPADHPLAKLSPDAANRLVVSPHIGGVTEGMFRRAWRTIWENIARAAVGETPVNIVNR
ncbi:MAG: 2-hydroxyacid dehydrogenase [Eggerthellaceae bacterium]|nr:2-hydroxyacid dehydrogenase [Eggerthellaceae bacterium]